MTNLLSFSALLIIKQQHNLVNSKVMFQIQTIFQEVSSEKKDK